MNWHLPPVVLGRFCFCWSFFCKSIKMPVVAALTGRNLFCPPAANLFLRCFLPKDINKEWSVSVFTNSVYRSSSMVQCIVIWGQSLFLPGGPWIFRHAWVLLYFNMFCFLILTLIFFFSYDLFAMSFHFCSFFCSNLLISWSANVFRYSHSLNALSPMSFFSCIKSWICCDSTTFPLRSSGVNPVRKENVSIVQ